MNAMTDPTKAEVTRARRLQAWELAYDGEAPAPDDIDWCACVTGAPVPTRAAAIAQALATLEAQTRAEYAARPCQCHSCEVLPMLHEQVAQMCEHLGSKRDEVPCDSWHLRDLIAKAADRLRQLEALEVLMARNTNETVFCFSYDGYGEPVRVWFRDDATKMGAGETLPAAALALAVKLGLMEAEG